MQACKAFTFPASRSNKESGVSDRNISSLLDGESDMSETKSWSDTPQSSAEGRQDLVGVFTPGEKRRLPVRGKLMPGWLFGHQGD